MENSENNLDSKGRFNVKSCPCEKSNKDGKFVPFKGHTKFGYCHSCSKTFYPEQLNSHEKKTYIPKIEAPIKYIPSVYLTNSLRNSAQNNFIIFLRNKFGEQQTEKLIELYQIGSSENSFGATIFWYINKVYSIRTGKIMMYDKHLGKRLQDSKYHPTWIHTLLNIPNENIRKGLFGEHLLSQFPMKPIAIVESEKTAIISSLYFPDFLWMATGGIANLTYERIKVLIGRKILLFPDLGRGYQDWNKIANSISNQMDIQVSNYLELNAPEEDKLEGFDLSDYLLNFDLNDFISSPETT